MLDGQQRLSSLIYALTAPDLSLKDSSQRRWFFLDLDLLLEEPDNDDIVFDRAKRELRGLDHPEPNTSSVSFRAPTLLTQRCVLRSGGTAIDDWARDKARRSARTVPL